MTVNNAVFNSEGTCTSSSMALNEDGSWTLTAVITGLEVVWTNGFSENFTLPVEATFKVLVPAEEDGNPNFVRESLWVWNPSDGAGSYTVTCEGFYMNPAG